MKNVSEPGFKAIHFLSPNTAGCNQISFGSQIFHITISHSVSVNKLSSVQSIEILRKLHATWSLISKRFPKFLILLLQIHLFFSKRNVSKSLIQPIFGLVPLCKEIKMHVFEHCQSLSKFMTIQKPKVESTEAIDPRLIYVSNIL